MSLSSTKEILSGKIAIGEKVTVAGWIRTRRDSKAGFSFLAVNDGSGFDNVQIIAPNTLNNYESEILKLTDQKPFIGHPSGKRANTHWFCFMKAGEL